MFLACTLKEKKNHLQSYHSLPLGNGEGCDFELTAQTYNSTACTE